MRWVGQLVRMQELNPCRELALLEPEGTRSVGKPKLRWLESVEEELKKIDWRRKSQDEKGGGQFWKKLRFTKDCNAKRKRRK